MAETILIKFGTGEFYKKIMEPFKFLPVHTKTHTVRAAPLIFRAGRRLSHGSWRLKALQNNKTHILCLHVLDFFLNKTSNVRNT